MKEGKTLYILIIILSPFLQQCKKAFEPAILKSDNSFLVVNGFINIGRDAITTIQLSRTLKLTDTVTNNPELHASLSIENESGQVFGLQENGSNGDYVSSQLSLDASARYRLNIVTANGNSYSSDFVTCKSTPPIDSLGWAQDSGLTVYVNTHDPSNNSRYYRWNYTETWQYQSQLESIWGVDSTGLIFFRDTNTQVHDCWKTAESTDIILGSSASLSEDVINRVPIGSLPDDDEKINFRYSILVRQYALTEEAYHYWQIIQRNSQQLGSLFDPQPSQINGNIHSLGDPNEMVVGFISATSQQEKRLFIKNRELNDWHSIPSGFACPTNFTDNTFPYFIYGDKSFGPWYFITNGPLVLTKNYCMDCTYQGGSNQKPSFW